MKKLLVLILLLVTVISFAAPVVADWSKYWADRLTTVGVVASVTKVNILYLVNFIATKSELRIVVTSSDPTVVFTKYDNITISATIIKNLNAIKTYNGLTTIYILTFPYTRTISIKDLLSPPKKQTIMSMTVLKDETQKKK